MKKVLVHGYTMDNLGDDLFFRVLASRYPDVLFYLPTLNVHYREKYADLPNLIVIDFLGISKVTTHKVYVLPKLYSRCCIKKFDAVVCIGGSLFIDRKNPTPKDRLEAENYSFICDWEIAEKAGVPYFVLGANWGPCYNNYFFDYFSRAFDSLTDLCFRDSYSAQLFAGKPSVRQSGDILMGNKLITDAVCSAKKKKQVAISVVDAERKCETACSARAYEARLAQICAEFVQKGYEIVLMSFCKSEHDEDTINRIAEKLDRKGHIHILNYRDNWQELLQAMAESEVVLASRFHAAVLGWTVGTPVYSIMYGNKTLHLMEDCGVAEGYVFLDDVEQLTAESILSQATLVDAKKFSGTDCAFQRLDQLLGKM
ncbi:MAG: polysaccharide pyruvyl transferase family protein [Eubacteriales bacterium]